MRMPISKGDTSFEVNGLFKNMILRGMSVKVKHMLYILFPSVSYFIDCAPAFSDEEAHMTKVRTMYSD